MASPPLLENELTRRATNAIGDADIGQLQLSGAGQALIHRSAAGPGLIVQAEVRCCGWQGRTPRA